ncbi:MAG: hypothetical protein LBH13_09055 [Cellulomonadaceae bacterium]|jgi:hypothetical protein|nr:hypothetical protein [Cellulomonadaceae bacterium]
MPKSRGASRRPYGTHVPLDVDRARGGSRLVENRSGEWVVRNTSSSEKTFTCPGCGQTIPQGVAHVVSWQRDGWGGESAGLERRRHWHTSCWQREQRRQ